MSVPRNTIPAVLVADQEHWFKQRGEWPPGTVVFIGEPPASGVGVTCPGCGEESFLPLGDKGWLWNGDAERPTLSPSCLSGCCQWHGYLRNGIWESC